jgi:hypothetical protein
MEWWNFTAAPERYETANDAATTFAEQPSQQATKGEVLKAAKLLGRHAERRVDPRDRISAIMVANS